MEWTGYGYTSTFVYDSSKNCIVFTPISASSHPNVKSAKTINFDNINTLHIDCGGNNLAGIYVAATNNVHTNTVLRDSETVIDCSDITGEQYLYFSARAADGGYYADIYNVWYE